MPAQDRRHGSATLYNAYDRHFQWNRLDGLDVVERRIATVLVTRMHPDNRTVEK
jgi:hypothetical protein